MVAIVVEHSLAVVLHAVEGQSPDAVPLLAREARDDDAIDASHAARRSHKVRCRAYQECDQIALELRLGGEAAEFRMLSVRATERIDGRLGIVHRAQLKVEAVDKVPHAAERDGLLELRVSQEQREAARSREDVRISA